MVNIVIVEKNGNCNEVIINDYHENELYKKCNFRKQEGFEKKHTWNIKIKNVKYNISLYARASGKHNNVNKFEFPPPLDNTLLYGNCALVNVKNDGSVKDLDIKTWNSIYEKLYGGFENLNDTNEQDEEETDELDHVPSNSKTKEGFLKDGFVVDNDSDNENYNEDTDSLETSDEDDDDNNEDSADDYSENGSELSPEDYIYSSDEE